MVECWYYVFYLISGVVLIETSKYIFYYLYISTTEMNCHESVYVLYGQSIIVETTELESLSVNLGTAIYECHWESPYLYHEPLETCWVLNKR